MSATSEPVPSGTNAMTIDRAVQINGLLIDAWMIREGVREGRAPGFLGVALAECIAATRMIRGTGPTRNPDGTQSFQCVVDESAIGRLYAWAVLREQMA